MTPVSSPLQQNSGVDECFSSLSANLRLKSPSPSEKQKTWLQRVQWEAGWGPSCSECLPPSTEPGSCSGTRTPRSRVFKTQGFPLAFRVPASRSVAAWVTSPRYKTHTAASLYRGPASPCGLSPLDLVSLPLCSRPGCGHSSVSSDDLGLAQEVTAPY